MEGGMMQGAAIVQIRLDLRAGGSQQVRPAGAYISYFQQPSFPRSRWILSSIVARRADGNSEWEEEEARQRPPLALRKMGAPVVR